MKREEFKAFINEKTKGSEAEGEEALYDAAVKAIETLEATAAELRTREKAVAEMFAADPRTGTFLSNWRAGSDPVVEMIRQFGPEFRAALEDPELQERLAEANSEYLERIGRERRLLEEFQENMARSLTMLDEKSAREEISDAELEAAWEWLRQVTDDGIRGIVSEDAIDMALKAIRHDRDVEAAGISGEVRGRNTAIEVHLKERSAGDGTVSHGKGASYGGRLRPKLPPLGILDAMERYRSVWD